MVEATAMVTTSAAPFETMRHFTSSAYRQCRLGCHRQIIVINFDEDAFTWAHFGCLHYCQPITRFDIRQTARTTGIIERFAALGHVGNAVFKLNKRVGAMIDTQAIASA